MQSVDCSMKCGDVMVMDKSYLDETLSGGIVELVTRKLTRSKSNLLLLIIASKSTYDTLRGSSS